MNKKTKSEQETQNKNWQGVDKDPMEEKQNSEKVTTNDLKAKKVDADPEAENQKDENIPPRS